MSSKQGVSFLRGAAILAAAAFISKLLGFTYRIPYQNITGDIGLDIYNSVYPIYMTLVAIAASGLPAAISKMVSERIAQQDRLGALQIFRAAVIALALAGFIVFLLLFFGAPAIANLAGDKTLVLAIRSASFALLIVPVTAAFRGFFQGHQNMLPTAVSQIVEQTVRVLTIIAAAYWLMKATGNALYAGAAAVFGAFTGACFSLIVLVYYWRKTGGMDDGGVRAIVTGSRKENVGALMVKIFRYALPICMGSLILPLFSLIDTFTVKNVLQWIGVPFHQAKWWFGIYTRGQPLVQFASFFATALSLALVPAIAESVTKRNAAYTRSAVAFALRLTLVIGLPASVGLALIAQPLNIMLYQDDKGTNALMILSFAPVFSTLCITSSGILQGLGRLYLPVGHLLIGVLVKLLLNLLLTSRWSIEGAALATVIGYLAAAALNLLAVKRSAGLTLDLNRFIVKPLLATLFMAAVVLLTIRLAGLAGNGGGTRAGCSLTALGAVLVGAAAYLMAVFRNRILTEDDFKWLPDGERFLSIARRFCLLPRKRES